MSVSIRPFHGEVEELTDDLTCSEVIEVLRSMTFTRPDYRLVSIDSGVRDFLLDALMRR